MFFTRYTSISSEALPGNQESQKKLENIFSPLICVKPKIITIFAGYRYGYD